jgi:ferric-dicitrate binding protein FerR (iron transport regulator)
MGSLILAVFLVTAFISGAFSEEAENSSAEVVYVSGSVNVKEKGGEQWDSLDVERRLGEGDEILTKRSGTVELRLPDGSVLKIGPNSHVIINSVGMVEVTRCATNSFELLYGKIRAVVAPFANKKSSFTIETDNALVGVRGTHFGVSHDKKEQKTEVACVDGEVELTPTDKVAKGLKPIVVKADEGISLVAGKIPEKPIKWADDTQKKFFKEMEFKSKDIKEFFEKGGKKIESEGEEIVEGIGEEINKGTEKIEKGSKKIINKIKKTFK